MIVDPALIGRVESAIVRERQAFAAGMAARGVSAAGSFEVAGGAAVFTGQGYFSNRAMGLGVSDSLSAGDLDRIEAFYDERGASSQVEMASIADRSLIALTGDRGYQITRMRNIYARRLDDVIAVGPLTTGMVEPSMVDACDRLLLDGFGYERDAERAHVSRWNHMLFEHPAMTSFVALDASRPIGAASVLVLDDVAVLGGAATLPADRGRGGQLSLIRARLAHARSSGCDLAVVTADPGGTSARNAERAGFVMATFHVVLRSAG